MRFCQQGLSMVIQNVNVPVYKIFFTKQNVITNQISIDLENRMIFGHKQKLFHHSRPALQFQNFLKIRSDKQSIIQSQSEPITEKVNNFQQLLKLSKNGQLIPEQKPPHSIYYKCNSQSSKSINNLTTYNSNDDNHFTYENYQSDQAYMKKLNKMVFGIEEWEEYKNDEKANKHKGISINKTSKKGKWQPIKDKIKKISQIDQREKLPYPSCETHKFRKFYQQIKNHKPLSRMHSQLIKTAPKLNYPTALLNLNLNDNQTTRFKQLKRIKKQFQKKARKQYGLEFSQKKPYRWNLQDSGQKDNADEQILFSQLQLGPLLVREKDGIKDGGKFKGFMRTKSNDKISRTLHVKQNDFDDDTSVPKGLLGAVQSNRCSTHQFGRKNTRPVANNFRPKLKKKYLDRPKTFKPTYTYIQI